MFPTITYIKFNWSLRQHASLSHSLSSLDKRNQYSPPSLGNWKDWTSFYVKIENKKAYATLRPRDCLTIPIFPNLNFSSPARMSEVASYFSKQWEVCVVFALRFFPSSLNKALDQLFSAHCLNSIYFFFLLPARSQLDVRKKRVRTNSLKQVSRSLTPRSRCLA